MAEDCEKKAADLGFDVTKQFLTLAFAGIAFVVGLSFNTPGTVSSLMLWLVVGIFGGSVVFGLLFLMRGVNLLSVEKSFDIYSPSLRGFAIFQIVFVLIGTGCLGTILKNHSASKVASVAHNMEIKLDSEHSVVYPIDPDKNTTVEIDGGKVKITAAKQ
jgi:hypothetical protein